MSPVSQLPADQRAVIELMLARGRNYTEIARLLSIEREVVRQRALAAFETLGPKTDIGAEQRALITDYLLGELPVRGRDDVRERLAREPAERAWARVVASEVASVAARPLPEIPVAQEERRAAEAGLDGVQAPGHALAAEPERDHPTAEPSAAETVDDVAPAAEARAADEPAAEEPDFDWPESGRASAAAPASEAAAAGAGEHTPLGAALKAEPAEHRGGVTAEPAPVGERSSGEAPGRSSRVGGAILLGIGALVAVAVIAVIVVTSGGSSKSTSSHTSSAVAGTPTATGTTGTTGTTTSPPILSTVKLTPTVAGSKAQGVAEAFAQSGKKYLAIVAVKLAPNNHNYYAVWLSSGPRQNHLLGFANPGVGSDGRLQALTPLQSRDAQYNRLVVSLETQGHPSAPGHVVLTGPFSLKPAP